MKQGLDHSTASLTVTVTNTMTAHLEDLVHHPVYGTFWVAYHAEVAARMALAPYLEDNEDAVGSELSICHHAMAGVGATVLISAQVVQVERSRVRCTFTIHHVASGTLLATGTQEQVVLSRDRLAELVSAAVMDGEGPTSE